MLSEFSEILCQVLVYPHMYICIFRSVCVDDKMWGCPIGWRGYRGSCYQILQSPRGITWADAKSVCSGKFANLATITDRNENRFVFSMLPKPKTGI